MADIIYVLLRTGDKYGTITVCASKNKATLKGLKKTLLSNQKAVESYRNALSTKKQELAKKWYYDNGLAATAEELYSVQERLDTYINKHLNDYTVELNIPLEIMSSCNLDMLYISYCYEIQISTLI